MSEGYIIETPQTDGKAPEDGADPNPHAGLLGMVAKWRQELADPNSVYAGRPDLIERANVEISALLLRAGVEEPKQDPLELARKQHNEAFSFHNKVIDDNTIEMLEERTEALEERYSTQQLEQMVSNLREQLGAEEYDKLVEDAEFYIDAAQLPLAAKADLLTLRAVASAGRYMWAYYRTMPGRREQDR